MSIEEAFAKFFILQGVSGQLKQFGYSFFETQFPAFPPQMGTPVGPGYILGPDDTLAVHIWDVPDSAFNRSFIVSVDRDGSIVIPQVGAIPVVGQTFAEASRLIRARLSKLLKRFELHISMAQLRSISIYVVGEVVRPGSYEISSLGTVSHALYAACGPAKTGSLRKVKLIREGKTVSELDFYRFLIDGDRTQDLRLRSGDTVVVSPIGPVAAVGGPVKRPAIYELKNPITLAELIELAGGLSPTADRQHGQIIRIKAGQKRVILDVELKDILPEADSQNPKGPAPKGGAIPSPTVQDGDFVRIGEVPTEIENTVNLLGAVRGPGFYEFRPGMRLSDILKPEKMLVDSYLDRAELARTDPLTYETTIIPISPKKLFQGIPEDNIDLHRLDKITVATQAKLPRVAIINGEIWRPGTYSIERGERLSSLLIRAGGFRPQAFPPGIVLIRESVMRSQQAELGKFVALQKQRLALAAANLSAGSASGNVSQGGMSQEQATLKVQEQALDQMATGIQLGRVVVKMESLEQLKDSPEDIPLEDNDRITIPQQPRTVTVMGAVHTPTSMVYQEALRLEDYIRIAGGATSDAKEKDVYLVRADGSAESSYLKVKEVKPGDTIIVPQEMEAKTRPLLLWQAVASILGSIMLAVAAITVIGR